VATKLNAVLTLGPVISEHRFEFEGAAGRDDGGEVRCHLDGDGPVEANWARVAPGLYSILLGGRSYEVRVRRSPAVSGALAAQGYEVRVGRAHYRVALRDPRSRRPGPGGGEAAGPREIIAPMPGRVVKLLVREGDEVSAGQGLLVMEAMKMQNELRAPRAGRVEKILTAEGAGVETGVALLRLG